MNKQEKQPDYDYITLILKKADVYGLKQEVEETAIASLIARKKLWDMVLEKL